MGCCSEWPLLVAFGGHQWCQPWGMGLIYAAGYYISSVGPSGGIGIYLRYYFWISGSNYMKEVKISAYTPPAGQVWQWIRLAFREFCYDSYFLFHHLNADFCLSTFFWACFGNGAYFYLSTFLRVLCFDNGTLIQENTLCHINVGISIGQSYKKIT